ncbi:MAG: pseudouridine synthase, partial [Pseudomonadota bacterium]
VLTDNGRLQARIADPKHKLSKTYLVQVEGKPAVPALDALRQGVTLKDGLTRPAEVSEIDTPELWPRNPPVRFRKTVPDAWLRLTIREGRNRQVRRMTAHLGLPCLRLVRIAIGDWTLDGLEPGQWHFVSSSES